MASNSSLVGQYWMFEYDMSSHLDLMSEFHRVCQFVLESLSICIRRLPQKHLHYVNLQQQWRCVLEVCTPSDKTSKFVLSSDISITVWLIILYLAYLWYIIEDTFWLICLTVTWTWPKNVILNIFECAKITSYCIHKYLP